MADTMTYRGTLVIRECWCGIGFAFPESLWDEHDRTGVKITCPLGHHVTWGEAEVDRQRRRADLARAQATHLRDQLDATERSRRAQKAATTRLRNRIANGVCPWCKRSFPDVLAHVSTKHPEHREAAQGAVGKDGADA